MSKERELLESCLDEFQYHEVPCPELLAQPEQEREPLDNVEIMTIAAEHTWDLKRFARAIEKALTALEVGNE